MTEILEAMHKVYFYFRSRGYFDQAQRIEAEIKKITEPKSRIKQNTVYIQAKAYNKKGLPLQQESP